MKVPQRSRAAVARGALRFTTRHKTEIPGLGLGRGPWQFYDSPSLAHWHGTSKAEGELLFLTGLPTQVINMYRVLLNSQ